MNIVLAVPAFAAHGVPAWICSGVGAGGCRSGKDSGYVVRRWTSLFMLSTVIWSTRIAQIGLELNGTSWPK